MPGNLTDNQPATADSAEKTGAKRLPRVAVHKFSSCDGCQLALLNLGDGLLQLANRIDLVHFAEAGLMAEDCDVDVALVEGSISTPEEEQRIRRIRAQSGYLISIGACATSGGLQALRNLNDSEADWRSAIYAQPAFISSLPHAHAIADYVHVDLALWGCPVTSRQVVNAISNLLLGVAPHDEADKLCMECKRRHAVCVMVTRDIPCMGPVTRSGCGAICPGMGRDCYGCFGPAENTNTRALHNRFEGIGLLPDDVARRFLLIHSATTEFNQAGKAAYGSGNDE